MSAYVRQNFGNIRKAILWVGFQDQFKHTFAYMKRTAFIYKNKPYNENKILKLIFYEFLKYLIGNYSTYLDIDTIKQYLNEIFD